MKIKAKIEKVFPTNKVLRAACTLIIEDEFIIKDVRIINGMKGLYVAMPRQLCKDEKYRDTCFAITRELRQKIDDIVFNAYNAALTCERLSTC